MGEREVNLPRAEAVGFARGLTGQAQGGLSGGQVDDLDIFPGDAPGESGTDGFHQGLLGSEAGGEALMTVGFAEGVGDFGVGVDALQEAFAESLVSLLDPRHFGQVRSNRKNHSFIVAQVE